MPLTKQVRDCHISDIPLYKIKDRRVITDIDHRGKAYIIRTTDLAGENPCFNTYDATDEVNAWGSQEALF